MMSFQVEEVEDQFHVLQRSAVQKPAAAAKQKLAVLDLKRATAVGIRMSRLRSDFMSAVPTHNIACCSTYPTCPALRHRQHACLTLDTAKSSIHSSSTCPAH